MATVFGGGADQLHGGSFRAEDVLLNWAGAGAAPVAGGVKAGALVQQAQWQCQRTVSMLYEIGSTNVYYVGNRRQGNATFSRVVAGSAAFKDLIAAFGNLCDPKDLTLNAQQAACKGPNNALTGGGVKYTLAGATLTSIGGSVTAQEIIINEQLGFMFLDLGYE